MVGMPKLWGQVFDQGFGQVSWGSSYIFTIVLGRRNTVFTVPTGTTKYSFTVLPGRSKTVEKNMYETSHILKVQCIKNLTVSVVDRL